MRELGISLYDTMKAHLQENEIKQYITILLKVPVYKEN